MKKRVFPIMAVLVMVLTVFAGVAQAEGTTLSAEAGITAYANIGAVALDSVDFPFMIDYQTDSLVVGTLDLPLYEAEFDPMVLVTADGDIVAFYPLDDPAAAKIVDVRSKNLDETLLEKAVKIVATAAGLATEAVEALDISHYDFRYPNATTLLLVAEYEPDGNEFTLNLDTGNTYYEKSYAFYRKYYPSFTSDNNTIEPVNFVEMNADYINIYDPFSSIYGHFGEDPLIDFDPGTVYTFAVAAGDHLGFGALAILYTGDAVNDITAADFSVTIELGLAPAIDPAFDLTPGGFEKIGVAYNDPSKMLEPTLSWYASTAPNYEYCIDEINNDACDTDWISTGSDTSVTLGKLKYETTYYWQVRAFNSTDIVVEADGGNWGSFTTDPGVAPEAFNKLTATLSEPEGSLSRVTLSWKESYSAYYYEVCVDTTEYCGPSEWHNVGVATTATIGDLLLDTPYYWQVRAVNDFGTTYAGGGDTPGENVIVDTGYWQSFTTRRFGKLRPLDGEAYNPTLPFRWEATPLATNGEYEYCLDQTDGDECDDDNWIKVSGTSMVINSKKGGLAAGTYYWQVRVEIITDNYVYANPILDDDGNPILDDDGNPTDDWWEFTVLSKKDERKIKLYKVEPLDEAVVGNSSIVLSWRDSISGPINFQYCYYSGETNTCSYDNNYWSDASALNATIGGLVDNTPYHWQVRANLGTVADPIWFYADNGEYWDFTTVPFVLSKVSPEDGATGQPISDLELSWVSNNPYTSFQYCYYPVDDGDTCTGVDNDANWDDVGTNTSVILSNLSGATTYNWQVRANLGTDLVPVWSYADNSDYWAFTTEAEPVSE